jgi:hypothetical protein
MEAILIQMRRHTSSLSQRVTIFCALFLVHTASAQQRTLAPPEFANWLPVTDAERQLSSPAVEKDAGAEVLVWRVHVVDELLGSNRDFQRVFYHYIRLKIFDEKGKEKAGTIDLTYREPGGILEVSGRTVRPDGSILELDKKTVYKRDLVRAGGRRTKAVSFAMPGVEPGAIIEYRWKQTENDNRFRYVRLHFQREFPVQKVTYFVKPLSSQYVPGEQMFLTPFNCKASPIKLENDGYNSTTLENVPAARTEPFAPSEPNLEPWALLYYRQGSLKDPDKYWSEEGKKVYRELKDSLKASDELKSAAAETVSGLQNNSEKLTALVSFLRKNVRNLNDPEITTAEREKFIEKLPNNRFRTAPEIFKSGIATSYEMNVVFAALAMQAGLEARPALVADRLEMTFTPKLADRYFIDDIAMAVKLGDAWKVLDVSRKSLTPGMLPWQAEGTMALLTDPKTPMFVETPLAPPEASAEQRTAHLRLAADGSLEGEVEESYTGHRAEDYRETVASRSPAQREEWFHDRIAAMFPDGDITAIQLVNIDDSTKPLLARYHLKAPLYAQVTGKRLLFQPIAFRRGQASPFSATERRFPVEFPYAWKEIDQIHIRLPEGFALDNADSPGNLNIGQPGSYVVNMTIGNGNQPELTTTREFTFGNKGILFFPQNSYAGLKKVFDEIQVRDGHSISLKGN